MIYFCYGSVYSNREGICIMSDDTKNAVHYKEPKDLKNILIPTAVTAVFGFISYYLALPAINVFNVGFWIWILFLAFTFCISAFAAGRTTSGEIKKAKYIVGELKVSTIIMLACIAALFLGVLSSAKIFNAKRYAGLIHVETAAFEEDMPETTNVSNIALMDTASASIIGNRTLGSLSSVVSQFEINSQYSQINYQNTPKKVANLEYAGFIKWMQNRKNGIPGMVMVDPLNNSAEYVEFAKTMKYADSAFLGKDLKRALRFSYPTKIFGKVFFEVDDNGTPYYIASCMKPHAGLFGAMDVNEVVIFNPCDGSSELYKLKDVPSWVDIVFDGDLASDKYNWYGTLSGGFFNSIFGNKNCKRATDDYGYIVRDDDVWYFTGVTSVNKDESNIGFILTNARTGEYKFYSVIGAEEYSAMHAAEGEVQEKGYTASFPSLINVNGQATYIMVLKDSGGLVKRYALVNVEKYSLVATGVTQQEAMNAYKKRLVEDNLLIPDESMYQTVSVRVTDVRMISVDNIPTVYVTAENGKVYKGYLNTDESLVLIREGDSLEIQAERTDIDDILLIRAWKRK